MDTLYRLDGRVPLGKAIPFGLQHVLAMFVSNLTPIILRVNECEVVGIIQMQIGKSRRINLQYPFQEHLVDLINLFQCNSVHGLPDGLRRKIIRIESEVIWQTGFLGPLCKGHFTAGIYNPVNNRQEQDPASGHSFEFTLLKALIKDIFKADEYSGLVHGHDRTMLIRLERNTRCSVRRAGDRSLCQIVLLCCELHKIFSRADVFQNNLARCFVGANASVLNQVVVRVALLDLFSDPCHVAPSLRRNLYGYYITFNVYYQASTGVFGRKTQNIALGATLRTQ